MHIFFRTAVLFINLIISFSVFSQININNTDPAIAIFDPQQANQTIDKLIARLPDKKISDIKDDIKAIAKLEILAKKCVDTNTQELNYVNQQLSVFNNEITTHKAIMDKRSLETKRDSLSNLISSCKLFVIRADKSITDFTQTAQELNTNKLFSRYASIWGNISLNMLTPQFIFQEFDWQKFTDESGIKLFNVFTTILLFFLLVCALISSIFLKRSLKEHIRNYNNESLRKELSFPLICVFEKYCMPLIFLSILSIFTSMFAFRAEKLIYITWFSYGALAYLLFLMVARFFFYPPKPADAFLNLPESTARAMIFRLMFLASMFLLAFVVYTIGHEQEWNHAVAHLFSALFITAVAINLISVIWLINRVPKMLYHYRVIRIILSATLAAGLITIWLAEWLDYHSLALYLLYGIALTFISGFLVFFIQKIIFTTLNSITTGDHTWQINIRYNLGLKKYQTIPEFIWLRGISYLFLWGSFILLLLKVWGLSAIYFNAIIKALIYGFKIVELSIIPSRIITAGILFTVLILTTRWLRHRMNRQTVIQVQRGEKEALATIIGYVGFSVALLFTLLIAGVNFAGLAVIAGALSVGIGFGLQNLAKDFISGLILLLERPVKIGDRIIVGQTEGYVKRISVRATHVSTTKGTDVLIPNSEFTSLQVTNLMFQDDYYRASLPVSVGYDADTDLVKQTLLEIAHSHPDIICDEGVAPIVYFVQFGQGTLNFELWYLIRDVNNRLKVRSELNYEIARLFKERNIKILYAQNDLHIRSWPQTPINVEEQKNKSSS